MRIREDALFEKILPPKNDIEQSFISARVHFFAIILFITATEFKKKKKINSLRILHHCPLTPKLYFVR